MPGCTEENGYWGARADGVNVFGPDEDERPRRNNAPVVANEVHALSLLNPEEFREIVAMPPHGTHGAEPQSCEVVTLAFMNKIFQQELPSGHQYSVINMPSATRRFSRFKLGSDHEFNSFPSSDR